MGNILGVHGIHNFSWTNDSFTDKFLAILSQDYQVVDVKYPKMLAMLGYFDFAIKRRAKVISDANTSEHDIVIAHSFGCLATIYAMQHYGAKFNKVIFFGAAAEHNVHLPDSFNQLYNIHSRADVALTLGKILPFHKFGSLGQMGYSGIDTRVINIDAENFNHSDYVHPKNICNWAHVIKSIIAGNYDGNIPVNLIPRPAQINRGLI